MKLRTLLLTSACIMATLAPAARAIPIAAVSSSLLTTDSTQLGRLSRNNIPQTWTGAEPFPGTVNPGSTYFYRTYDYSSGLFTGAPYVEITTFEPNNTFVYFFSAYAGSYDPTNKALNWLGDAGFSGNYQNNTGGDFQVILPGNTDLILVVNTTLAARGGTGTPFQFTVDAYADTSYNDPTPIPEPSTFLTLGTGLLAVAGAARRKFKM